MGWDFSFGGRKGELGTAPTVVQCKHSHRWCKLCTCKPRRTRWPDANGVFALGADGGGCRVSAHSDNAAAGEESLEICANVFRKSVAKEIPKQGADRAGFVVQIVDAAFCFRLAQQILRPIEPRSTQRSRTVSDQGKFPWVFELLQNQKMFFFDNWKEERRTRTLRFLAVISLTLPSAQASTSLSGQKFRTTITTSSWVRESRTTALSQGAIER